MRTYVVALFWCGLATVRSGTDRTVVTVNGTIHSDGASESLSRVLRDMYTTLSENIRQNSRKLKLEDFSLGIFSGTKGRLLGLRDYSLVNRNTTASADGRNMNVSFEFTVPALQATWEKSVCMGYACAMTIELRNCVFAMRISMDADECTIDHLAYLKRYGSARCQANYARTSPVSIGLVETTVNVLSQVLNTRPLEKIVKDNVNYAILHLPLFNGTDIRRLCDEYKAAFPHDRY